MEALLKEAKIEANSNGERIPIYEEALAVSRGGFGIVYKRDISETYVNTYNKEWLTAWDANMDLQLCFDFYAIITYISDYYTKDDSGTLKYIKDVLKDATENLKSKLRLVMNTFLTHRQIGESEAYYRILPSLKLKSANTESKFLPTGFKKNRSVFHQRLEDEKVKYCDGAIKIDGKEGFFIERPTLIDKFQRRDLDEDKTLDQLSYIQFGKFYKSSRTVPKKKRKIDEEESEQEMYDNQNKKSMKRSRKKFKIDETDSEQEFNNREDKEKKKLSRKKRKIDNCEDGKNKKPSRKKRKINENNGQEFDDNVDRKCKKRSKRKRKSDEVNSEEEFSNSEEDEETNNQSNIEMITKNSGKNDYEKMWLPEFIKLKNVKPGEPPFMKLRSPYMIRFHKVNRTKNPHEFYFSELQKYKPFQNEEELFPNDESKCEELYWSEKENLDRVKRLVMPHLEGVEEGTERAEELIDSNAGVDLDPTNEQDNDDCEEEGVQDYPDYFVKDPTDFFEKNEASVNDSVYSTIQLYDDKKLDKMTLTLDEEQRRVVEIGVNYANNLLKFKNSKDIKDRGGLKIPNLVVQGGAGSGKSCVIDVLTQRMEKILRVSGGIPSHPYIVKAAFTGTAAANIDGQTMTSAFSFSFGNQFFSLSDKKRDEKREVLQNLVAVVIDEYSMIKADMLYQLDLRLREIKEKPDVPMGGVALFFFGDILQLRPVMARWIMEKPEHDNFQISYTLDPLWQKADVILLVKNHRQESDKQYADLLNRVRIGKQNDKDIELLKTRVRQDGHPDLPENALRVMSTNQDVNRYNEIKLAMLEGEEQILEALILSKTQKELKPMVANTGAIKGSQLQKTLKLKIGAKVMLTTNVDTTDGLTNGTFGQVFGFEKDNKGKIIGVLVEFLKEKSGKELRKRRPDLQRKYPGRNITVIKRFEQEYSLSGRPNGSATARAIQFPLKLVFAATSHKVQGMTIKKPECLVIDLRGRLQAAMAYIMLSRVQELSQLYILGHLPEDKIYACPQALEELDRMEKVALNNVMEGKKPKVSSINVRSLNKNFEHMQSVSMIKKCDVICIQETWIYHDCDITNDFNLKEYSSHFTNIGRGKGIVTYYKENFKFNKEVGNPSYQMCKVSSEDTDIINVYRSSNAPASFLDDLKNLIDADKTTHIIGDFNICYRKYRQNNKMIQYLEGKGFRYVMKFFSNM